MQYGSSQFSRSQITFFFGTTTKTVSKSPYTKEVVVSLAYKFFSTSRRAMLPGNCLLTNELIANSRSVSDVLVGHDDGVDERHDGSAV